MFSPLPKAFGLNTLERFRKGISRVRVNMYVCVYVCMYVSVHIYGRTFIGKMMFLSP